jgi:hypothetical protein
MSTEGRLNGTPTGARARGCTRDYLPTILMFPQIERTTDPCLVPAQAEAPACLSYAWCTVMPA